MRKGKKGGRRRRTSPIVTVTFARNVANPYSARDTTERERERERERPENNSDTNLSWLLVVYRLVWAAVL